MISLSRDTTSVLSEFVSARAPRRDIIATGPLTKEVDRPESRGCRWAASLFSAEARNKFNEGGGRVQGVGPVR